MNIIGYKIDGGCPKVRLTMTALYAMINVINTYSVKDFNSPISANALISQN